MKEFKSSSQFLLGSEKRSFSFRNCWWKKLRIKVINLGWGKNRAVYSHRGSQLIVKKAVNWVKKNFFSIVKTFEDSNIVLKRKNSTDRISREEKKRRKIKFSGRNFSIKGNIFVSLFKYIDYEPEKRPTKLSSAFMLASVESRDSQKLNRKKRLFRMFRGCRGFLSVDKL